MTHYSTYDSPIGTMILVAGTQGIQRIWVQTADAPFIPQTNCVRDEHALAPALSQIQAYFAGELKEFTLDLDLQGTDFQVRTWTALGSVPYGRTVCYSDLAEQVGSPKASRAIGMAMRNNPLVLVLPCHRVVGRSGKLTGFLYGVNVKRQMLEFETQNLESDKPLGWNK
jgi:methylated-DNA-[protein]-cysteine S-methyltransferase